MVLPCNSTAFHMVCQGHVITPNVELPFPQSQYTAQHVASVDADPHVHIEAGCLPYESGTGAV